MIDPKLFEDDKDLIIDTLKRRGEDTRFLDYIGTALKHRKDVLKQRDDLNHKKRVYAEAYAELIKDGAIDDAKIISEKAIDIKYDLKELNDRLDNAEESFRLLAMSVPNLLAPDVPKGKGAEDNKVVRKSIDKYFTKDKGRANHNFAHVEIAKDLLDLSRAAKLSGHGFSILRGKLARLERAIGQFFIDYHTEINGYEEVAVPYIVDKEMMEGTGQLPKFEMDMYIASETWGNPTPQYLIPTGEVPLTNLYRDEIIPEADLPIKLAALTPCFRAEAGSHGKEARGLIRQHQFNKVELVRFVKPEFGEQAHQEVLADAELMLSLLGLPYRVVLLCAGDTSFAARKCYDLEVWIPSQKTYREISSVSHFADFQARRAKIRYKGPNTGKKAKLVHTINGSGLAVGRTLVAILENFLQEDGTVVVPEVLRPYTKFNLIEF